MGDDPLRGYGFTIRQRQVVRRIGRLDLSYAAIARELDISPRTVETHATHAARIIGLTHLSGPRAAIRQFWHELLRDAA